MQVMAYLFLHSSSSGEVSLPSFLQMGKLRLLRIEKVIGTIRDGTILFSDVL